MTEPRDELERLIADVARSQPMRRAPASLEARVFEQIAAQPAWRQGFGHWPLMLRAAFLLASCGFIKLALTGVTWAADFVRTDVVDVSALHRTGEVVSTTYSLGETILHAIPQVWLYGGAAVGFALYALLFGLGTFAYRTLYVQR